MGREGALLAEIKREERARQAKQSEKAALEARRIKKLGPKRYEARRPDVLLSDEQVKMLNICRDWLRSYLPHTLQKVDRVKYGLLNEQDLARCLALDPKMPASRRVLAVPFAP